MVLSRKQNSFICVYYYLLVQNAESSVVFKFAHSVFSEHQSNSKKKRKVRQLGFGIARHPRPAQQRQRRQPFTTLFPRIPNLFGSCLCLSLDSPILAACCGLFCSLFFSSPTRFQRDIVSEWFRNSTFGINYWRAIIECIQRILFMINYQLV